MPNARLSTANAVLLVGSGLLLGGALLFQHVGGLPPCEMCFWQRWPHVAALAIGLAAWAAARSPVRRPLLLLGALAVVVAAGLGLFHVGVEQGWWEGPTQCSAGLTAGADILTQVLATPLVRCDAIAWQLFGVSLAGYNAILSTLFAGAVAWLTLRKA